MTNNYIKMCEKAEEIQKLWKPELGDWCYLKEIDDRIQILCFNEESRRIIKKGIWLPTQEQLQEMIDDLRVKLFDKPHFMLLKLFNDATNMNYEENSYYWQFNSMNELWLSFIMSGKYHKIWDGGNWQKS